ncbi:polypeptide N-acetylgalactosaminyltransferase 1-like [Haliotis cracherodii]|uniref:polypeptide N-acetylgalactosaminyltransferase 1-like n=1 Tax=Haliotis cracherodii TaxID=6455 RepID=UPI0039EC38B1
MSRIPLCRTVSKWVPRRWWHVVSLGLVTYIVCTFVFTGHYFQSHKKATDSEAKPSDAFSRFVISSGSDAKQPVKKQDAVMAQSLINNGHKRNDALVVNHNQSEAKLKDDDDDSDDVEDGEKPRKAAAEHKRNIQKDMNQEVFAQPEAKDQQYPPLVFNDVGPGQMGEPVFIDEKNLDGEEKGIYKAGFSNNDFNEYASNLISVDRRLPDIRDPLCKNLTYTGVLPDTSVIICFLNEAWSVLVRSVHSVINMTPPHLLREIILVDDGSSHENLKKPLEVYMTRFPKVKILRNMQPEGLMRSRILGAKAASGKVLTFLDSHIECTTNWLPPLLMRIRGNSTRVVWPAIPGIDKNTFAFKTDVDAKVLQVGIFTWSLVYTWETPRLEDRETPISPVKSPTMPGGLFAIDKDFFFHVGTYDDGMSFWGAENVEISFRIWMCGGTIELIPCSVVGHIFRSKNPNSGGANTGKWLRNTLRTAAVWLDEYKHFYSRVSGRKLVNYGDVSARLQLRQQLKCRSFQWYLENVYTTVFLPTRAKLSGLIHSKHDSSFCLHGESDHINRLVLMRKCEKKYFHNQIFYVMPNDELRLIANCMDIGKGRPILYPCHRLKGNQEIRYTENRTMYHPPSNTCLTWLEHSDKLDFRACDGGYRQEWFWENILWTEV